VLSGFILVHVYPELPTAQSVRAFFAARAARIWPAHLFAIALLLALVGTNNLHQGGFISTNLNVGGDFFAIIANLLLLQGWVPIKDVFFSLNGLSWTVSTELGFYVLFPLLIYRFEDTWWWKLLGSACLLALLIVICTVFNIPEWSLDYNGVTSFGLLYINPLGRLFEFVLGMSMALAWRRFRPAVGNHLAFWTVIELAAVLLVLWNARYLTWLAVFHVRSTPFPVTEEWLLHAGSCLSFAFLIFCFASGTGLIGRFLCLTPCQRSHR
jgi:peptidoglycan/LPS O-acetylase OafA/YrhL